MKKPKTQKKRKHRAPKKRVDLAQDPEPMKIVIGVVKSFQISKKKWNVMIDHPDVPEDFQVSGNSSEAAIGAAVKALPDLFNVNVREIPREG